MTDEKTENLQSEYGGKGIKQQGKERTYEQKKAMIETLIPYIEQGISIEDACDLIDEKKGKYKLPHRAVWKTLRDYPELRRLVRVARNKMKIVAEHGLAKHIHQGNMTAIQFLLKHRYRDKYSTLNKIELEDGLLTDGEENDLSEKKKKELDDLIL